MIEKGVEAPARLMLVSLVMAAQVGRTVEGGLIFHAPVIIRFSYASPLRSWSGRSTLVRVGALALGSVGLIPPYEA